MPEGLKIQIGAEIGGAVAGIKKVDSELKILGIGADKVGLSFKNLTQKVEFFGGGVRKLSVPVLGATAAIGKAETQLRKLSPASNQATQSMINLGRVVQDAPFGFLGIANNLNPLLESFQRLKQSTGTTSGAMKALGASLMGVGGLGFALSIVSSLLIVFGDKILGIGKSFDGAGAEAEKFKNQINDLNDAFDDLKSGLDFIGETDLLKLKIAKGEGPETDILGLKNTIELNKQLIHDLGLQIPEYEAKMKAFREIEDQVRKFPSLPGVKEPELTKLVRIFGTVTDIPESFLDKLNNNEKAAISIFKTNEKELQKLQKQKQDTEDDNTKKLLQIGLTRANIQRDAFKKEQEEYKKALEALKKFQEERARLFEQTAFAPVKQIDTKDTLKEFLFDEIIRLTNEAKGKPIKLSYILQPLGTSAALIKKEIDSVQAALAGGLGLNIEGVNVAKSPLTQLQKQSVLLANTVSNTLTPAFEGLFDAILSGENPMKAFFQGLGNAVKRLIQQLVAAAVTALAISFIFPSGVGGVKGFGAIFGKLLGLQHGGIVFGPTLAMIGEGGGTSSSNPEVVAPLDRLKNLLGGFQAAPARERLITEVSGDNLRIILARNERKQRRGT